MPRKNVKALGGRPLVAWAIAAATEARLVDRVCVSTDDDEILGLAETTLAGCGLRRPPEIATSESMAIEYVTHALDTFARAGEAFDAVVIVQPTSPFTEGPDIDAALELLDRSGADSVVTVVKLAHDLHPVKMKLLEGDRLIPYVEEERGRMAYQQLPDVYVRNGSVYAIRCSTLASGELLGSDSRGVVMPRERSVDINEPIDLAWAEFLLTSGRVEDRSPQ